MNCIFSATDFSDSAQNAVKYAAGLAATSKARLILFHAFHVPIVASEVPTMMFTLSEMEKEGMANLDKQAKELTLEYPTIAEINCICRHGFVVEEIESLVNTLKVDLVVMGLQGHSIISEKLIGSNTTELVKQAKFPVLVVHSNLKFKPIQRILLATDNRIPDNKRFLDPLIALSKSLAAHIHILKVIVNKHSNLQLDTAEQGLALDEYLNQTEHSFYEVMADDVLTGINSFSEKKQIDLTVVIARDHSFFESLFSKNNLRNIVYHASTPLLTLHE